MEGSDSDSDAPYVDINSFLELGIKADTTPLKTTPSPKINGKSESDPLLMTSSMNSMKPVIKKTPIRRPEITFVDVNRIMEQPKSLPRLPSSITLTRNKTPTPQFATLKSRTNISTRPRMINNAFQTQLNPQRQLFRPQLNPRLSNLTNRHPVNNRQSNNTAQPQLNPGLPNITIRPVMNPRFPPNLKLPNSINRPRPQNTLPRNAIRPHFNPPSNRPQLGPRVFNRPQFNPRLQNRAIRPQFSPRLSALTIRPLINNQQSNNMVRPLLNPRPRNPTIRPQLTSRFQNIGTRPLACPRFSENSTKRQPNRYEIERYRQLVPARGLAPHIQTINAIRAKTGVTLVPLKLPTAVTAAVTLQAPNITPLARRNSGANNGIKLEPGVRSLKRRCNPEDNACNICLRTFVQRKSLRKHMRSAHKNVMNELPSRKSSRIPKDLVKSMVDASSSESEMDDKEEVEVLPPPLKKPKELINLSDEESTNLAQLEEDDTEDMMDISQFLEVHLSHATSPIKKPVSKQTTNCYVKLSRLSEDVCRANVTYLVRKVGSEYCIVLPKEVPSCKDPVEPSRIELPDEEATQEKEPPIILVDELINTESPTCEHMETSETSNDASSPYLTDGALPNVEEVMMGVNCALSRVEDILNVDGIMSSVDVNMLDVDDIMSSVEVLLRVDGNMPNVDGYLPNVDDVLPFVDGPGISPAVCDVCRECFDNDHLLIEHLNAHLADSESLP